MFKNISWASYGTFILIILVGYYVAIICLYYLNDIKQIFSANSSLIFGGKVAKKIIGNNRIGESGDALIKKINQSDLHLVVQKLMNEIKNTLEHAAANRLNKEEVVFALQQVTRGYNEIKESALNAFVTNYILIECNIYCSIQLDNDELENLWL